MAMFIQEERTVKDWIYASLLIIALVATACDAFGNPAQITAVSPYNTLEAADTYDDASTDRTATGDTMVECGETDEGEELPCPLPLDAKVDRALLRVMMQLHGHFPIRTRARGLVCGTSAAGQPATVATAELPQGFAKR
ncbi:MAG: hypothetical protein ABL931_10715 [Usitatibacteraceae bacterium]